MDLNSSALWGIIGLLGGFLCSFIFYKLGNKAKRLTYNINSQVLITNNLSKIEGLNITYGDQPINNLATTTIILKSVGKDVIEMKDFGQAKPLCFKTTGEFLLQDNIDSTITKNSRPDNLMKAKLEGNDKILLEYDYLSQGDTITFTVLHTGEISLDGKLKAGTLLKSDLLKKITNVIEVISNIAIVFWLFLGLFLYIGISGMDGTFKSIGNFIINLVLGITLIEYYRKFKK